MTKMSMGHAKRWRILAASGCSAVLLAGCSEEGQFNLFKPQAGEPEVVAAADNSVKLIERDVEAPEVFQVTDRGLWDGRPSLGGVWVAHSDVGEPERVIIRNTENSKFVIGALFRKERDNPGPALMVSSDAAEALGLLAGSPAQLNVTALRRESTPDPEALAAAEMEAETAAGLDGLDAPADVQATALDPLVGAAAAIDAAEAETLDEASSQSLPFEPEDAVAATTAVATAPAPAPQPAAAPAPARSSSLEKPFLQIGIFSVEQNAKNTATAMRQAGMVPTVTEQSSSGKTFWRVVVGPAQDKSERSILLEKVKGIGFEDAYAVTN